MGSTPATEDARRTGRKGVRKPWAGVVGVLTFGLGAALAGIGVHLLSTRPRPWEGVSVVLLGCGMLLVSLGSWREVRGAPPRLGLRVAVYVLMLAAVLVHFLLA